MKRIIISLIVIIVNTIAYAYAYDFKLDDIYYKKLSNTEVEITCIDEKFSGDISIPEKVTYMGVEYDVTSIGNSAFKNYSGLTGSLSIPNSVTYIGSFAFCNCSGLTGSLSIPKTVTSIGEYAFYGCSGLTGELILPNGITTIENSTFSGCTGLTGTLSIPSTVTKIGNSAFNGCSGLTGTLLIPNTVTSIGDFAFEGCSGFSGLLILSNSISAIRYGTFAGCTGLTGSLIIPNSVTEISESAFEGCSGLTGPLVIPKDVSFRRKAFFNCERLSLVRSKITENDRIGIDGSIFEGIFSNAKLEVPPGMLYKYQTTSWSLHFKSIIEYANDDYFFTIVTNDNGEVSYNNSIIRNQIKTFNIAKNASPIIKLSPDDGYRIKSVKVNGTDITSKIYNNSLTVGNISDDTLLEVEFEAIPTTTCILSVKVIGNGSANYNDTSVRGKTSTFTINKGMSVTITFAPDAGYRIASVKVNGTDVTSSVTDNQLILNNVKENLVIDVSFGDLSVGDLFYAKTVEGVLMTFKVTDAVNKTCQVGNGTNPAIDVSTTGTVTIPSEVNGYKVNEIGKKAFWNSYFYVNRFILPEGIISIGNWAFYQESSLLEAINIPSSVQTIGDRAFANCNHLKYVYINDLKSWCNISFEGVWSNPICYAGCLYINNQLITNLQIPEGVTKLNSNAFIYYKLLNTVTLPSTLASIGTSAFSYCENLSTVVSNIYLTIFNIR